MPAAETLPAGRLRLNEPLPPLTAPALLLALVVAGGRLCDDAELDRCTR